MREPIKTLATWGRFELRWWTFIPGTWSRNPLYRLRRLFPKRTKYGPRHTYWKWWRMELAVERKYASEAERFNATWGVEAPKDLW